MDGMSSSRVASALSYDPDTKYALAMAKISDVTRRTSVDSETT